MPYQMESFDERELRWKPMQEGAGGRVWRPRRTATEAIAKCMAWTGFIFIPDMQVRNLETGEVVWRGLMTPFEFKGEWDWTSPEAGPPIHHRQEKLAEKMARGELKSKPETARPAPVSQEGLF